MSLSDFQQVKSKLRILILGPYRREEVKARLKELQNCLIGKGFLEVKLAEDFPDTKRYSPDLDVHYTRKSRKLIEYWAHVPIFVFFKAADNLGVTTELIYTCTRIEKKLSNCAVFFEEGLDISSQIKGSIKNTKKLSYETFKNSTELCELAFGHSLKMLYRLFYYIV